MDQIRAIAKLIWQQRFWVLSVLGLIVAAVCWNMAAGTLQAQFDSRKGEIEGKFSAMNELSGKTVHPNQTVNDENQKQVDRQTEIVNAVWKTLYERQTESVLKWPAELPAEFLSYIEKLKFRDPIESRMRGFYQNYIGTRFKGLLKIVDAKELAEGSSAYGGGGGRGEYDGGARGYAGSMGAPGMEEDYLVEWLDQDKLRAKLAFASAKPTALQIWVTQEDLWVYETLLNVIAKTNKARGATRPDNTAIRTIVLLEVGAGASMGVSPGMVFMPRGAAVSGEMATGEGDYGRGEYAAGGGEMSYGRGEMDGEMGGGRGYGGYGMEGVDPAMNDATLLTNRYLGDDGNPLPGEGDLGKEFRQLPIRMELVIDQRWIPRLLLECANSPLPIEVKQIRINPDKAMSGFEGAGGMSSSSYGGAGSAVTPNDPVFSLLQVKGVVFIYNEPTEGPAAAPETADEQMAAAQ